MIYGDNKSGRAGTENVKPLTSCFCKSIRENLKLEIRRQSKKNERLPHFSRRHRSSLQVESLAAGAGLRHMIIIHGPLLAVKTVTNESLLFLFTRLPAAPSPRAFIQHLLAHEERQEDQQQCPEVLAVLTRSSVGRKSVILYPLPQSFSPIHDPVLSTQ